ncbi:CaiB/BaiF CoA transferase family protein [Clostridium uliginosum]|uniref:Cinnamoyl-CoA:phenyllactate CoA-transferase n=1 Tax=Clostridium uliginosum TaxID=119641 RepID=A0A1I1MT98_9CLOT|nr:CaiB/BaiF CoA-transferase family protein [Clostridium uliginosum]SFC88599.1 cinnamoyl-CoA:phenyllactate CoA-transferase [Clostridium uliginosum]
MSNKPLSGVKVVELATFIAAATAGRFLADLGADVIKIESAKGDPLRYTAPSEGRPLDMYENTTWDLENGNKRCISLNMKTSEGKDAFFKLLDTTDILITNWRPQALKRAELDYENLKKRYPSLVYAMCTGYGEYGPDKDLPGFDFTAFFARGGYLETLRQKGSVPMNVVPGLGDHNVGMNLVAGILAALYQAKNTGKGEKVTTSLFQSAVFNMGMMVQAAQYKDTGIPYPVNIREADNPFNSAWETKEGRYIQTCMPDYNTYYKKFMSAIGRTDLVDCEKYFPIQNLQKAGIGYEVYDIVMESMKTMTIAECSEKLKAADVPFSVAQSWEEILEDKQAWANECFYSMKYENGNVRTLVRPPVNFSEMGEPDYAHGPMIGEQGKDILKEIGYTDEEISNLINNKTLYIMK